MGMAVSRQGLLVVLAVALGLSASTQAFAYLMYLAPTLGPPLWRAGWLAYYAPWRIVLWVYWWGAQAPSAFVLPAILGLASAGVTLYQGLPKRPTAGQAHWATEQELHEAECRARHGIVLGWTGRLWWKRLICYGGPLHCFFVGRTGGGKTNTLTSTLYLYQHSVLLNDPKNQLYTRTAGYRATLGEVVRFAPTEAVTAGYNFWDRIDPTSEEAFREVELLSHYLLEKEENAKQSTAGLLFEGLARQFLNGLSLYGLTTGIATCGADFNDLVTLADWDTLCDAMAAHPHPLVQKAGKLGAKGKKGEVQDSLRITLERALAIFNDPRVAAMTRTTTFPLPRLREAARPCTLYWHVPFRDQARLRRLTRLFFHQALDYCTQEPFLLERKATRRTPAHPLLFVTEELPSLGYFPMATEGLDYVRDYGIQMLILTPSMQKLIAEYGAHHNFLEGTYIQAVFGVSHTKTAREFADSIGEHDVRRVRTTTQRGKRSRTIETHKEALMDATGIRKLRKGKVLLLLGEHQLVAAQAPYYTHGPWSRESQRPVP
jgi:type IV secretion system protein VirD4